MIANFQYGWSVFVSPLHKAHGWSVSNIQLTFTIFVALETWATPLNGWLADRLGPHLGPRVVMGAGGLFVALGWIINSYATSLPILYLGGALSGLGAGAVYCTAVGTAVKWFHRSSRPGGRSCCRRLRCRRCADDNSHPNGHQNNRLRIGVLLGWIAPGRRCSDRVAVHSESKSRRSRGASFREGAADHI
ncbi:MAG: MFS transporter [Methylovirgula sp.]